MWLRTPLGGNRCLPWLSIGIPEERLRRFRRVGVLEAQNHVNDSFVAD
jgi:hypothetical protein